MDYQKTELEIKENEKIEETQENSKKKRVKFKDLPSKEKKKRAIIGIICLVLAFVLIFGDVFGSSDSGSANLGFTLAEFVDRYNSTVDEHLKQDTTAAELVQAKDKLKLDIEYFLPDEEYDDTYIATNGNMGYIVMMDESGNKVQAVRFAFTNEVTEAQMEMMLVFCKWFAEAVKPDMGKAYYTETLTKTIENGETREEGIAYVWKVEENCYAYEIYYAA